MIEQYPRLGVIEGFYGRSWAQPDRIRMLGWLSALAFTHYLYAPKEDGLMRRAWRTPWPAAQRRKLSELGAAGAAAGVSVSAGLSPFALYAAYDRPAKAALRSRVGEIADCGVQGLALLFDDMPGDVDALAARQAEIVGDVHHWVAPLALRLCPTYYSDDPTLDRVFGTRPADYLEELGQALPADVPVFWTGAEVCAETLRLDHVRETAARCGRALAIWDNYPVNDSRTRSEHLYVGPFEQRDRLPGDVVESHWSNAMNQPALSLPALASLADLYDAPAAENARRETFADAGITDRLIEACLPLSQRERSSLDGGLRDSLRREAAAGTPAARELAAWLAGAYRFDPACLTD